MRAASGGCRLSGVGPCVAIWILLLIRDGAAGSADVAALRAELDDQRLRRMTQNARTLASRRFLRKGVSVERAAEIMWTYTSPELYELLVLGRGWSAKRYGDFIADALVAALLPELILDDGVMVTPVMVTTFVIACCSCRRPRSPSRRRRRSRPGRTASRRRGARRRSRR